MKSWLKGLLIGAIIGIILYFLGWIFEYSFIRNLISINTRYLITSPLCTYYLPGDEAVICFVIFGLPFNVIVYGLLGAIIGWVISKYKFYFCYTKTYISLLRF
jgi:hypothetical protein